MASVVGDTLEEALAHGRGVERPFRCHVHDDTMPSASVNVLKQVWFCYACGASGHVDVNQAPKPDDLLAMLEPDRAARIVPDLYHQAFLTAPVIYWHTRVAPYAAHAMGLGHDTLTDTATFPVHTSSGLCAGVGRRALDGSHPRYVYPPGWSASRSLFGPTEPAPIVILVEGALDATAVAAVGAVGVAVYGSSLHAAQVPLLMRMNPSWVMAGFDNDQYGDKGAKATWALLNQHTRVTRLRWPGGAKDAAEVPHATRATFLTSCVGGGPYAEEVARWPHRVAQMKDTYTEFLTDSVA